MPIERSGFKKTKTQSGELVNDAKYCLFTTKERSNIVVACENSVPGKIINESLNDAQDLKYFTYSLFFLNSLKVNSLGRKTKPNILI